jgi:hypothetical protein
MILTGIKLNKLRVEGNCVPVMLVDINFFMHGEINKAELDISPSPHEVCRGVVDRFIEELPITYRESAKKRAWGIARNIYNKYLLVEGKSTTKILMIVQAWMAQLCNEGLIDVQDEVFIDMMNQIDEIFSTGETNGYISTVGGEPVEKSGDDVKARRASAFKHVQKLHDKLMDKDLYLSIRNDNGELEIV